MKRGPNILGVGAFGRRWWRRLGSRATPLEEGDNISGLGWGLRFRLWCRLRYGRGFRGGLWCRLHYRRRGLLDHDSGEFEEPHVRRFAVGEILHALDEADFIHHLVQLSGRRTVNLAFYQPLAVHLLLEGGKLALAATVGARLLLVIAAVFWGQELPHAVMREDARHRPQGEGLFVCCRGIERHLPLRVADVGALEGSELFDNGWVVACPAHR